MTKDDERYPGHDPRYKNLSEKELPLTECLKDTVARVVPFWENVILPDIKAGKKIIIAAHGNSLRALVKYLDNISDADITELNIPTGMPLVYELDDNFKAVYKSWKAGEITATKAMELTGLKRNTFYRRVSEYEEN